MGEAPTERELRTPLLRRIRFAGMFINLHALSRNLRKRPPNRFTRHQVERLRADLAALSE